MITLETLDDINWVNLYRVAWQGQPVTIAESLLCRVDDGHRRFVQLIERGVPSYGVTTGLGRLVSADLDDAARAELPNNMLRARAAAIGEPFPRPAARALMLIRLVNFLSGRSGVRRELCLQLIDYLNAGLAPWIPSLGHGMAADATANTHAFQCVIGEGFVYTADGSRQAAAAALAAQGLQPLQLTGREGLALINGISGAPALAADAFYCLESLLALANLVAAVSLEGLAAPRDSLDPVVGELCSEPGVAKTIGILRKHLDHSQVEPHKLQAPVSYRVIPQVHGALVDALGGLRDKIEHCLADFSDNPLFDGERSLSVGSFHNQHLVNQVEQVALALAHVGALAERRLHRLMNAEYTGLNAQLAARPGLDAGLVVAHKASVDIAARLRVLAQPVSLYTGDTSAGQEDYMSMAIPAIERLYEMQRLCRALFAYELLGGITALRQRGVRPGDGVQAVLDYFAQRLPPTQRDRPPGADVEILLAQFDIAEFVALTR